MAQGQWVADGGELVPAVGSAVEVRQRYTERWAGGFEVARVDVDAGEPAVAVRRRSDGSVLPATFHPRDVRTS